MTTGEPARVGEDFSVRLPHDREAARLARDLVDALLTAHLELHRVTDELRQDAALVVHELVINAVLHGGPSPEEEIELSTRIESSGLVISVRDWGHEGRVAAKPPSHEAPNGRGLAIVEALSASWSVDRSTGTRVTAHLAL